MKGDKCFVLENPYGDTKAYYTGMCCSETPLIQMAELKQTEQAVQDDTCHTIIVFLWNKHTSTTSFQFVDIAQTQQKHIIMSSSKCRLMRFNTLMNKHHKEKKSVCVSFSYYFIFDGIMCVLVTLQERGHFVMVIIKGMHLIK